MSLLKNSSIYLTANLLNAAIPFILLPILTRYLTPIEYGQIAMFQVLLSALTTFIGINCTGSANRKFYDDNIDHDTLRNFNGSCVQILIVTSIITLLFSLAFGEQLSDFLSIPLSWILIAVLISSFTFIATLRLGQWQIRNQAKYFGVLQVSSSFINMLLSLQLVITLKQGASGRVDAQLITTVVIAIVAILLLYKDKLLKLFIWRPEQIKEALSFGIPLIPHHIGFFLLSSVDRFFINKEIGLAEAGIYMVAVQLSTVLTILFDALNKAYVPWLYGKLKINNHSDKIKIVKYTYFYFAILTIIALIAFFVGPLLFIFIAGEKYSRGADIIGWLCLGQIFGGMYLMVTNYIFFSKKTGGLALTTITTGIVNIILLITLIPLFGLIGAAYSFSISKFCQFIFTWLISYNSVKMPWFKKEI
ncbi:lipopolysaccharide biosynthesis protein [Providencia heimbachae]|uniref:lipopolysaccharide biosynthesis protein n=1 Tax=Providencia TaxID=586 RepID=UPI0008392D5C|nr:oligosaccharide flippase family protein [Providencia heimbachae]NIH23980.1 oligosaccharide flippase family protein [Providencia heimbachae]